MTDYNEVKKADVVVVGAGIAGLVAARELGAAGCDVLVVEALDEPGGRIHTVSHGSLYAEAGGTVVTRDEAETCALLQTLGLASFVELGEHGTELYLNGSFFRLSSFDASVSGPRDLLALARFALATRRAGPSGLRSLGLRDYLAYRRVAAEMKRLSARIEYPYELDGHPDLDNVTFESFLRRFGRRLAPLLNLHLAVTAGTHASEISLFWGIVTAVWNVSGGFLWLKGGMSRATDRLAEHMGERLHLSTRVTQLCRGKLWRLSCESPGRKLALDARAVVVAVGAREMPRVEGGLPEWKAGALDAVRHGAYIVVHVLSKVRFWESAIASGYLLCGGTVFADLVDGTRDQEGRSGILICFIAGPEARTRLGDSDARIVTEATKDLETLFPGCTPHIEGCSVFRWRDAIPYFPPRFAAHLRALRRGHDGLFYAGDYTEGAGINDAVVSGLRAAREAIAYLAGGPGTGLS